MYVTTIPCFLPKMKIFCKSWLLVVVYWLKAALEMLCVQWPCSHSVYVFKCVITLCVPCASLVIHTALKISWLRAVYGYDMTKNGWLKWILKLLNRISITTIHCLPSIWKLSYVGQNDHIQIDFRLVCTHTATINGHNAYKSAFIPSVN